MSSLIPHFMPRSLRELGTDRRGVTAVEYGLLVGLIAVALIAVFSTFEGDIAGLFNGVGNKISTETTTING